MKTTFFSTHAFEKPYFQKINQEFGHSIRFLEARLDPLTAELAKGSLAVCCFVNDCLNRQVIEALASSGVELLALRSAGFNHVDLRAAREVNLRVVRVPEYSPYAVAEHTVGLLLTLNRKIHRAYNRVREANFNLDGLVGFDLHGKTIGVVGTGRIGVVFSKIMKGFGCKVVAYDLFPNQDLIEQGIEYVSLEEIWRLSDVISLHVPLKTDTHHLINAESIKKMKSGVVILNSSRGALIETKALIDALKSGHVGGAGLDVYEEEEGLFFHDLSNTVIQDDQIARLLTFPNVLITSHQGFLTQEALRNIAQTTLQNISDFENGRDLVNEIEAD